MTSPTECGFNYSVNKYAGARGSGPDCLIRTAHNFANRGGLRLSGHPASFSMVTGGQGLFGIAEWMLQKEERKSRQRTPYRFGYFV